MQKVRRTGGAREGGFPGAAKILAQLTAANGAAGHLEHDTLKRKRVGLVALERVPVRDGTLLESFEGVPIGAGHQRPAGPHGRPAGRDGLRRARLRRARHPHPGHRARQAGADGSEHHAFRAARYFRG